MLRTRFWLLLVLGIGFTILWGSGEREEARAEKQAAAESRPGDESPAPVDPILASLCETPARVAGQDNESPAPALCRDQTPTLRARRLPLLVRPPTPLLPLRADLAAGLLSTPPPAA